MACKRISKRADLVCIGKRDKMVEFFNRKTLPTADSFTIDLKSDFTAWCMVETRRGVEKFDGTNVSRGPDTTVFYTDAGYEPKLEKKQICKLNNKYFEVNRFDNINEENRTLEIVCTQLGDLTDSNGDEIKTSWAKLE